MLRAAVDRRTPVNLAKADSYSVGATLFDALTGRLPAPLADTAPHIEYHAYFFRRVKQLLLSPLSATQA